MKYMEVLQQNQFNITYRPVVFCVIKCTKEGMNMFKYLANIAEKYAKATNTASFVYWVFHQPKMPASLIKKD